MTKYLLIASTEAYSGKSATILGITHYLQAKGISLAYGKPLGTFIDKNDDRVNEEDVSFIASTLNLSPERVRSPILYLEPATIAKRLAGQDCFDYTQAIKDCFANINEDLLLLEGSGNLWEGSLFNLSVAEIADLLDASILLVAPYHDSLLVDSLLAAKQFLGDRTIGISINNIPPDRLEEIAALVKPFLEQRGIDVLGMFPKNDLLRSVSVRELVKQLQAKVLCRSDRLDLMVESLTIGAMNVNAALEYFRKGKNMAVVTGGDRTDLQLAALETSTQCLILTGHVPPQPLILSRAEYLEIPILSVPLDTLTTVEIIDRAFGTVRLQEPIKVRCIQELTAQYFDLNKLLEKLNFC